MTETNRRSRQRRGARYGAEDRARARSRRDSEGAPRSTANARAREAGAFFAQELANSRLLQTIATFLLVALTVSLVMIARTNIQPYYELVMRTSEDSSWVVSLPIIGHIASVFGALVGSISSVLIWGATQIFQCLWILIYLDRLAYEVAVLESAKAQARYHQVINQGGHSKRLAQRAIRIPTMFIEWSLHISGAAYIWDMIIGLNQYPLTDSFNEFLYAMRHGRWDLIDWTNVMNLGSMMFLFEMIAIPTVIVWQWRKASRLARQN